LSETLYIAYNKINISLKNIWKNEIIEVLVETSCNPYPNLYDELASESFSSSIFFLNVRIMSFTSAINSIFCLLINANTLFKKRKG
jgi:hypothetical protein